MRTRVKINLAYAVNRFSLFYQTRRSRQILCNVSRILFGDIERTFVENSEIRNVNALAVFAGYVHRDVIHPILIFRRRKVDNEFVPNVFDGRFDVFSVKSEMVNVLIERPIVSVIGVDVVYREEQTSRVVISYFKRDGLIIVSFGLKVKSAGVPICGVVFVEISLGYAIDRFGLLNKACARGQFLCDFAVIADDFGVGFKVFEILDISDRRYVFGPR